jgi:hypothetical protein
MNGLRWKKSGPDNKNALQSVNDTQKSTSTVKATTRRGISAPSSALNSARCLA